MATIDELKKFYARVMNCQNTIEECPSITRCEGINPVPRGFYFSQKKIKLPIKILAVAKNPGHPQENENKHYYNSKGEKLKRLKLVDAHLDFVEVMFKNKTNPFHKRLSRYLSKILDLNEDEIFSKAAYTNLVKCSTWNPQGYINDKTMKTCFKFFLIEVELFQPSVILALHTRVRDFLIKNESELPIQANCIIYIKHPTYSMGNKEDEELDKIKEKIKECI